MRTVTFYQNWSGRAPALEFVAALSEKERKKVYRVLDIVERNDRVPAQCLKKLAGTGGLWEVRVDYAGKAFRLLGFFDGSALMILTNGFSKKTEQTPATEIEVARGRRQDYLRRKGQR